MQSFFSWHYKQVLMKCLRCYKCLSWSLQMFFRLCALRLLAVCAWKPVICAKHEPGALCHVTCFCFDAARIDEKFNASGSFCVQWLSAWRCCHHWLVWCESHELLSRVLDCLCIKEILTPCFMRGTMKEIWHFILFLPLLGHPLLI